MPRPRRPCAWPPADHGDSGCPRRAGADTIDPSWVGSGREETLLGLELAVTPGVAVLVCGLAARRFRVAQPVLLLACGALPGAPHRGGNDHANHHTRQHRPRGWRHRPGLHGDDLLL